VSSASNVKPKLRGVLHEIAFFVSLITGPVLVATSPADYRVGVSVYSISLSSMFGASALYHRPMWRPDVRKWLRKLDHAMIFVFIAGTFTPIAIALDNDTWARNALLIIWIAAAAGVALQFLPFNIPKPIGTLLYLILGWMGPTLMPAIYDQMGWAPLFFLVMGGILYTVGAVMYAKGAPNIKQDVFGYHELFHALVIGAAICQYIAIFLAVR
jgi:hemolysin III